MVRKGGEDDLTKRASLLRRDSVHGPFNGTITIDEDENAIIANGNMIRVIYADAPDKVDYTAYGIHDAIVIDNTGNWRDREGLGRHLKRKGPRKVVLTAPGKGDIPNIVYGVNNELLTDDENDHLGGELHDQRDRAGPEGGQRRIRHRQAATSRPCHSYTNDQNLIDNYHKKRAPRPRRRRSTWSSPRPAPRRPSPRRCPSWRAS